MTENDDIQQPAASGEPPTEEAPTRELPPGESSADPGGERPPRRFFRSRDDRVIAGVAGGLGRYFDIDPVIIRIAFAVSILFGGLGVIAYLAVALFVPSENGNGAPVTSSRGRGVPDRSAPCRRHWRRPGLAQREIGRGGTPGSTRVG